MDSPVATWFPDWRQTTSVSTPMPVRRRCEKAARELQEGRQKAANNAPGDMMHQCTLEKARLSRRQGLSRRARKRACSAMSAVTLLLIPMFISGRLVGVQTITTDGEKKFLFGQQ
jgi:phage/plasmid primase-like uncharacterized protein